MSIANVSIVGNLVKTPQQKQFPSGKILTTMVVAVNTPIREKRGGEAADFYKVETWGKLAELVATRLDKGNQVTANGRLSMDKWTDDKGRERVTPTIAANEVAFPQRLKSSGVDAFAEASNERSSLESAYSRSGSAESAAATMSEAPAAPKKEAESEDEDEYDESEDESSSGYGEPNTTTKPAPMRTRRATPG